MAPSNYALDERKIWSGSAGASRETGVQLTIAEQPGSALILYRRTG
jgi:hypothetical protein